MVNRFKISDEFHYVLERFGFEQVRDVSNLAFLLDQNQNSPDFLKSTTFKDLLDEAVDALIIRRCYECGVIFANISPNKIITNYHINRENTEISCREVIE